VHKFWIIWVAVVIHVLWGVSILFDPTPLNATPLYTIDAFLGRSRIWLAFALFTSAYFAAFGVIRKAEERDPAHLIWFIPQQFLLVLSAFGAIRAIIEGQYADGTVIDSWHIFSDQLPIVVIGVMYVLSIWEHFLFPDLPTPTKENRLWRLLRRLRFPWRRSSSLSPPS